MTLKQNAPGEALPMKSSASKSAINSSSKYCAENILRIIISPHRWKLYYLAHRDEFKVETK